MIKMPSIRPGAQDEPLRILVVESRYYEHIAEELLKGAHATLEAAGCNIETLTVPGALEIPAAISIALNDGEYDGFVALGCVIRGETTHYDIVAGESARAIMDLNLEGACIGNGILTVENEAQALARARVSEMNKGAGAAEACLALARYRIAAEQERDDV
jgi:6,7-dimethyl-8-ribityllumazine synthase